MRIEVSLTPEAIGSRDWPPPQVEGLAGSWVEFVGMVRGEEDGQPIAALEYQAYAEMAVRQMKRVITELSERSPCLLVRVVHRVGVVPVGETAIQVGVASEHRREGLALLAAFLDRLKQEVPIWKVRALPAPSFSC